MLVLDVWLDALDAELPTTILPASTSTTTRSSLYQVQPPLALNCVTSAAVQLSGNVAGSVGGVQGHWVRDSGGLSPPPEPPAVAAPEPPVPTGPEPPEPLEPPAALPAPGAPPETGPTPPLPMGVPPPPLAAPPVPRGSVPPVPTGGGVLSPHAASSKSGVSANEKREVRLEVIRSVPRSSCSSTRRRRRHRGWHACRGRRWSGFRPP